MPRSQVYTDSFSCTFRTLESPQPLPAAPACVTFQNASKWPFSFDAQSNLEKNRASRLTYLRQELQVGDLHRTSGRPARSRNLAPSRPGRGCAPLHPHALNWDEPHYPHPIPLPASLRGSAGRRGTVTRAVPVPAGHPVCRFPARPNATRPSFCASPSRVSPAPPPLPLVTPLSATWSHLPFCFPCPPAVLSGAQAVGPAAVGLVLRAGPAPRAHTEPRGDGRAPAGADQHRRRAALEKCLQRQCHPPAGHQHLPLGLLCMTLQTRLQWGQSKEAWTLAGLRDRLSFPSCCGNRGPWRLRRQEPLPQPALWPRGERETKEVSGFAQGHTAGLALGFLTPALFPLCCFTFLPQKHRFHPLGASIEQLLLYVSVF